jgi:hypothetical protein
VKKLHLVELYPPATAWWHVYAGLYCSLDGAKARGISHTYQSQPTTSTLDMAAKVKEARKELIPTIHLFGNSLTCYSFFNEDGKGWGQVLEKHYEGRVEVINDGKYTLISWNL